MRGQDNDINERESPGRCRPLQVPWVNLQQGWHIHTGDKSTNCPSNISYGKTPSYTAKHEYQLTSQDQTLQISRHLHLPLRLRELDDNCRDRKLHSNLPNEVLSQNTWDLLPTTKDQEVVSTCGRWDTLLATVTRRKMNWFGHICRHNSLANTIL